MIDQDKCVGCCYLHFDVPVWSNHAVWYGSDAKMRIVRRDSRRDAGLRGRLPEPGDRV